MREVTLQMPIAVKIKQEQPDLEEAEDICYQLEEKDKQLMLEQMRERDYFQKEWLKNWVNIELRELVRYDRDNVRNQLDLYSDDIQKLEKVLNKLEEQKSAQINKISHDLERELLALQSENRAFTHEREDVEKELVKLD
jgi:hypothetical protein